MPGKFVEKAVLFIILFAGIKWPLLPEGLGFQLEEKKHSQMARVADTAASKGELALGQNILVQVADTAASEGYQKPVFSDQKTEEDLIVIHIKKGMSLHSVSEFLKEKGLIKSVFYFKVLAWLRGKSTKLQSGEYAFQRHTPAWEILNVIVEGKTRLYRITFPEGYNIYEMAELLEAEHSLKKEAFISLCHNTDLIYELLKEKRSSLEGYLFPDTYYFPQPVDPKQLISRMVQGFLKVYDRLSGRGTRQAGSDYLRLTRHEAVILASIVEKETGRAEERALIASVFYNRLKKKMRLESDPTVLYGMMQEAGSLIFLNIQKKDLLRKTPYNTYRVSGFPAGPVSNPGAGALKAVFEPEQSPFFYFVSRNDGSHVFSKTYREHKKAVDRYQRKLKIQKK